MPHMALMTTLELGDPVAATVLVEPDDRALHRTTVDRGHR